MDLRSFNVQDVFYSFIGVFEKFIFLQKKKKCVLMNFIICILLGYEILHHRFYYLVVRYYIILKL